MAAYLIAQLGKNYADAKTALAEKFHSNSNFRCMIKRKSISCTFFIHDNRYHKM